MIYKIYEAMKNNPLIAEKVGNRIKFYEYPENGDITGVCIIIDPLSPSRPVKTADNKRVAYEYFYQVDVWSKSMNDTHEVMKVISDILWDIGFTESGSGIDEYDSDFVIFRQAKRFIGQFEEL